MKSPLSAFFPGLTVSIIIMVSLFACNTQKPPAGPEVVREAVKVLDLTLSGDERTRDLVRHEAWAAARLNHPDVASLHDFVHLGHFGVLVMQLVSGEPLKEPVAWYGPIVMNTQAELRLAFDELERGTFLRER